MTEDRCRLVLIVPDLADPAERTEVLRNALRGGDVASVIIPPPWAITGSTRCAAAINGLAP